MDAVTVNVGYIH